MSEQSTAKKLGEAADDAEKRPEDDVHLSLWDHIGELRTRLIYGTYAAAAGIAVAYVFAEKIYAWLMDPLVQALTHNARPTGDCLPPLLCPVQVPEIVFTNPVEPLFVYIRIACYTGIFLASPAILYQLWAFVRPGLYRSERKLVVPFVTLGSLFFVAGGAFARLVVLPFAFDVLIGQYATGPLKALPAMGESLDLTLAMVLAFGLVFELPLIITLLARLGLVSSAFLSKYRRHAAVVNVIVAAIITPTGDPFNLALMAVPLILFYELGVIGAKMVERKKLAAEQAAAAAA